MAAYIDHAAYYVSDLSWHIGFFETVFGMGLTKQRTNPDGLREVWLSGGLQLCETGSTELSDGRTAHLCLLVEDLEDVRSQALSRGCSPMEKHHWIRLPEGLCIEMFSARQGVIPTLCAMEKKQ